MPELEERLADLATAVAWPPTPALAGRVMRYLPAKVGAPPAAGPRDGWRRALARNRWARAAAAVIFVLALALAYTPSREAVADWVNLHLQLIHEAHPPQPSPLPPGPIGHRLGLGGRSSLTAAQARVVWHVEVPSSLGAPDEVYLQEPPAGPPLGEVSLVFGPRPGIAVAPQTGAGVLITEARGRVDQLLFGKIVGPGTTVTDVSVAGHAGYWISGQPHDFFFFDADGNGRAETLRLAANTLIFDDNGTVVRIEGNLTEAQALAIAASLR
jgi:hypothetical protein